jgi:hypothetical protein
MSCFGSSLAGSRIAPISVTSWISRLPEADIVTGERQVAVAPKRT